MNEFFRRYQNLFILLAILIAGLSLLLASLRDKSTLSTPERIFIATFAPFQDAVSWAAISGESIWNNYIYLVDTKSKNHTLASEVSRLKFLNNKLTEQIKTFHRIEGLLTFSDLSSIEYKAARVIGRDTTNRAHVAIINRGAKDGIVEGAPVFTHHGLVGKVTRVAGSASKVLLLTDVRSAVDALLQESRDRLVVEGTNRSVLNSRYLSVDAAVNVGDNVVSSGLGGVYPKGMMIGTVRSISRKEGGLFLEAEVAPSAKLDKIEELLILIAGKEGAQP